MTDLPAWLDTMVEAVVNTLEAHSPMGGCGFRYSPPETGADDWAVFIYPTPVQLQGGDADGTLVDPGFSLDLEVLRDLFDEVVTFHWTAHPFSEYDHDHPAVAIEGRFQGHSVYVAIQAYAPEDEPPGLTLDVNARDKRALH